MLKHLMTSLANVIIVLGFAVILIFVVSAYAQPDFIERVGCWLTNDNDVSESICFIQSQLDSPY